MYKFFTLTGEIIIDHVRCSDCLGKPCLDSCKPGILRESEGKPILAVDAVEVKKGKCIECLACELACEFHGNQALKIFLPLPAVKS